jgi:hypothetical protein
MSIVVDDRISCDSIEGNADGFQWPEGSSPVAAGKAAVQLVKVQPCQLLGSGT